MFAIDKDMVKQLINMSYKDTLKIFEDFYSLSASIEFSSVFRKIHSLNTFVINFAYCRGPEK